MDNDNVYVTTSIPYVNAAPHLGHALEFVQADVLARHRRLRGRRVRLLSGTDDNAFKNVTAAREAGVDTAAFVDRNAGEFEGLRSLLDLSYDDFIRTGSDPRHRPGVERLWRQCAARGDFYRRSYEGLYCLACEQFYAPQDLLHPGEPTALCPEHGTPLESVREQNWFFRLSAYADQIESAIRGGAVRIEPEQRKNEILALLDRGLKDFSVSRPASRAGGWGIGVPDDPDQVIYVWWDALANYVTALDYGGNQHAYAEWWKDSAERIHVVGKGISRFHAVNWLGLLLSAGQRLPSAVFIHEYLSIDGAKISKTIGNGLPPRAVVDRYGRDALRWWLCSDVARLGDTDFTDRRLVRRYQQDLAGGVGNLVNRTCALVNQFRDGDTREECAETAGPLASQARTLPEEIDGALGGFDFRTACLAIRALVGEANRYIEGNRPWEIARQRPTEQKDATRLDRILSTLVVSCRVLVRELGPFIPDGASRLSAQLGTAARVGIGGPVFPGIT